MKSDIFSLFSADDEDKSAAQHFAKTAKKILGKKNVFTSDEVAKTWGLEKNYEIPIPSLTETLEWCAEQNAAGETDWHLVYGPGQSMAEMFVKRGENEKKQPCFHPAVNFYPEDYYAINHMHPDRAEESPWIAETAKVGYRLIDFSPRFKRVPYDEQEERIKSLGGKFFRISAPVFTEAVMSVFMISKKRIAEDWCHWAPEKHMWGGYHAAIGPFTPYGLLIMPGYEGTGHGVVIGRENDL